MLTISGIYCFLGKPRSFLPGCLFRHWTCCRWVDKGGNAQGEHLQKLPVPLMLAFGACSGLVAQTATYPFDVVRRQMQVCATSSLTTLSAQRDFPAVYSIIWSVCSNMCSAHEPQYTIFKPLTWHHLRLQVQGLKQLKGVTIDQLGGQQICSTLQGLRLIVQQQGPRALFAGLSLNYIKVVPSTAIGFTIYDALKQYLGLPQHL